MCLVSFGSIVSSFEFTCNKMCYTNKIAIAMCYSALNCCNLGWPSEGIDKSEKMVTAGVLHINCSKAKHQHTLHPIDGSAANISSELQ